jgi:hypothetical protein
MAEKTCNRCNVAKPLANFYPHKQTRDGYLNQCKECTKRANQENYLREKERAKERASTWYRENKSRALELAEEWKKANPERVAQTRERYSPRRAELTKEYRAKNPERFAEAQRRHAKRHPEKARARSTVTRAVHEGRLSKPRHCEDCKKAVANPVDLHGHHEDYGKPLDIEWLCRGCHNQRHSSKRLFVESRAKVKA